MFAVFPTPGLRVPAPAPISSLASVPVSPAPALASVTPAPITARSCWLTTAAATSSSGRLAALLGRLVVLARLGLLDGGDGVDVLVADRLPALPVLVRTLVDLIHGDNVTFLQRK